jgi:hypothetical protein
MKNATRNLLATAAIAAAIGVVNVPTASAECTGVSNCGNNSGNTGLTTTQNRLDELKFQGTGDYSSIGDSITEGEGTDGVSNTLNISEGELKLKWTKKPGEAPTLSGQGMTRNAGAALQESIGKMGSRASALVDGNTSMDAHMSLRQKTQKQQ